MEKESSTAKLAYEKQISDLKAQCADDHAVAQLKKEEHQTDERLKNEEEQTATGVLRLKVQALEQELQMAKDATAEKETKVVLLQKAQAEANESCSQEVAALKRNLQAVTATARSGSQEVANL